ncbi:MAG: glycosyltransferase [Chitinophagaceae bacterium]
MTQQIESYKRGSVSEAVFSIVIPTWNNLSFLQLCIESIRKNSTHRHQVIVHVNEGTDGTLEWIKAQPDVDYTYSPANIGVCYALNYARHLVSTSYLLYLNDDMYVCPGWDAALYKEIKQIGHKYFFVSGTAVEPLPQSDCAIGKDYGTDIASFREEELLKEFAALPMNDWQGATWPPNVVHIDIWDMVGGYSIEFSPGMYSDPDFSMKLWQLGVREFKGVSDSRVYHFGSKSVSRIVKNHGYYQFINKWGITSSTLTKYYLHRGKKFNGRLKEPSISLSLKIKNLFKRVKSSFGKQYNNTGDLVSSGL